MGIFLGAHFGGDRPPRWDRVFLILKWIGLLQPLYGFK